MKKIISLLISGMMLFAGCGKAPGNSVQTEPETAAPAAEPSSSPQTEETPAQAVIEDPATVFFTTDISPEGLVKIYEALNWQPEGKVGVKLSTGEPPASNYLRPELIKDLVEKHSQGIQ